MKSFLAILLACVAVHTTSAQETNIESTVEGSKMNFEAPIFGVKHRDVKNTWNLVAINEVVIGLNYMLDTPEGMKPYGLYGTISLTELQYRPGKGGDVFSAAISYSYCLNYLDKDKAYSSDASIIDKPESWAKSRRSLRSDWIFGITAGYTREFKNIKTGIYVNPGFGVTDLTNYYKLKDYPNISRRDFISKEYNGFRMSFKTGIWYDCAGVVFEYEPVFGRNSGPIKRYEAFKIGFSIKF